jgi:predicted protein tyrosine phosphatase
MKVLFICNQNENRSKTAEELFSTQFETMSAGLYNEKPVTEKQVGWADVIIVMEESQRKELANRFAKQYMKKQILSLDIPDIYYYNQPELIEKLKARINELVEPLIK